MITANEKYQAKWTAASAKIFVTTCFDPTLQIAESCCRVVPDYRFEEQNNPTCTNIGFSTNHVPCLGKTKKGDKRERSFYAVMVTWQLISSNAGQAAEQNNHQCQWKDLFRVRTSHHDQCLGAILPACQI